MVMLGRTEVAVAGCGLLAAISRTAESAPWHRPNPGRPRLPRVYGRITRGDSFEACANRTAHAAPQASRPAAYHLAHHWEGQYGQRFKARRYSGRGARSWRD